MALREETKGTMGTRIFDVIRWANVQKRELAEVLDRPASFVSRLPSNPERITVEVVHQTAKLCAGRGILGHVTWEQVRAFILDGDDLPGPTSLSPSEAPSGGGGRLSVVNNEGLDSARSKRDMPRYNEADAA